MSRSSEDIRLLSIDNIQQVRRLLLTSEYLYQRFTQEELPTILTHYLALGVFHDSSLRAFILTQTVHAPSAWIAGYCVSWTESRAYATLLETLLVHLAPHLTERGVRYLHYSGNDVEHDWLRGVLLTQGFMPYRLLHAYDKLDYSLPAQGNQQVIIRPVTARDIPTLLPIEEACFEELWRYDGRAFNDIAATHPYFVVAELQGKVVGYQFNAIDGEFGYLVRIAVHPEVGGKGIGTRLMAEAIRFFQRERVLRIMLNSQEENTYAHRLYEWFGFVRVPQLGFVLRKQL